MTHARKAWPEGMRWLALGGVVLLCGCSALLGGGPGRKQVRAAGPPPTSTNAPQATPRPDAGPNPYLELLKGNEDLRQGNPEAWGDGGSQIVGRTFEPVFFDEGSIELDATGRQRLAEHAKWLAENQRVWITLVGHSDAQSTLERGYNIGMARALAARDFLIGQGMDPLRIYPTSTGQDMLDFEFHAHESEPLAHRVEVLGFIAPPGYATPKPSPSTPEAAPEKEAPAAPPTGTDIPRN